MTNRGGINWPTKSVVTRRWPLAAAGAVGLLALDAPAAGEDRKRIERTYEGTSGKLQDALDKALELLDEDLPEGNVAGAQGSWKHFEVTGARGGFAGAQTVKVKIVATRNPDWKS